MKIKYIWIVMAWMVFCGTSVSAGTTYHLAANGNDGNDGTTRETAKATFEAAMACLTGQGDVLIVHDGVYTNTSELVIKNNCTVMSENGAEKRIL